MPSLRARSTVAVMPPSTARQVSFQSRTGSPLLPREKDDRCRASCCCSLSAARMISRMASVDMTRVNPARPATPTAAVDFPTPVAPAMMSNLGGRDERVWAVCCAIPTRWAMRLRCRGEHMRVLPVLALPFFVLTPREPTDGPLNRVALEVAWPMN